jgi:valyl-tRNA synthetase
VPFLTEEIWYHLYDYSPDDTTRTIMKAQWPKSEPALVKPDLESTIQKVQDVVYAIRNIRSEMNITPAKRITAMIKTDNHNLISLLENNKIYINTLAGVDNLEMAMKMKKPNWSASAIVKDAEIFIPLEGVIDTDKEKNRLEKEITKARELLEKTNRKLSNEDFLKRAPKEIIEKEKAKKEDYEKMIDKLNQNLERIMGW